jgi:hypothetical protein
MRTAATPAQQLFDRPAGEVGRLRRAEPIEYGRDKVRGVVRPGARSRLNPWALGDKPTMGCVVP